MPAARGRDVLVAAARMYFLEGRSQQDIASTLGTSRSNVSRMLTAAREQGVVEIRIHDAAGRATDLEEQLVERFGIADARIAGFVPDVAPLDQVGQLAADWLLESLRDRQRVALSWGTSLQAMVWATHSDRPRKVEVVPLVGGLSSVAAGVTGEDLVRELAGRLGATYRFLHAPALLESKAAVQTLQREGSIRAALDAARDAHVAFVGIGAVGVGSSADIIKGLQLNDRERRAFEAAGPVGDVCARFFDAAGHPIAGAVRDRVLAVSLDDLKAIPTVVGVAAGAEKAPGVLGALRGGIVDVLVTDVSAARAVLALDARDGAQTAAPAQRAAR